MATGGHVLQQQKGSVEARIKGLVNNDLKEICKAYNYQVSGTKPVLQGRCIEILNDIVHRGDRTAFDELLYRVGNHGHARSPHASSRSAFPTSAAAADIKHRSPPDNLSTYPYHNHMPSNNRVPPHGAPRLPSGGKYFRQSPFYENHETVLPLQDLPESHKPEMPQNRHTVRTTVSLSADIVHRMKSDPAMKLLLYCGSGVNQYSHVDVAFPNQLEVKINGDDVRGNFKGLKNKPGSTKPADITDKVRKSAGYQNQLHVTYALTQKRFSFAVYLARYVPADVLTARIRDGRHGGGIITKQRVLAEMTTANADSDIAATSVRMSLKDPISTVRITLPVRSTVCSHNQCFDGSMFLQLQDQAPQWVCPVCNKAISYESLCVDKYFEEILQKTATSIEKVDIEPDGRWHMIKEDEAQPNGHSSRDNRAAHDDDFDDDDIVEVVDPSSKSRPTNGASLAKGFTPSLLSPMSALNTPPLSSRGPSAAPSAASASRGEKRAANSVIDLTISDDEDEPPRPAKRHSTNTSTQPITSVNSYSTPSSLSDTRTYSYYGGQTHGADNFRPVVSNLAGPPGNHGRGSAAPEYGTHFGNNFASRLDSPFRSGNSSSPSIPVNSAGGGGSWESNISRSSAPSTPAFQPFTIRPLHQTSAAQQQQSMRLPPMSANPRDGYGSSWRSDQSSNYSHSPPG